MRSKLARHLGSQCYFSAIISTKNDKTRNKRICLEKVCRLGFPDIITSHVWVECEDLYDKHYQPGDRVKFKALITPYKKSNGEQDVKLVDIQEMERVSAKYRKPKRWKSLADCCN